jgi:hypothetical protein
MPPPSFKTQPVSLFLRTEQRVFWVLVVRLYVLSFSLSFPCFSSFSQCSVLTLCFLRKCEKQITPCVKYDYGLIVMIMSGAMSVYSFY